MKTARYRIEPGENVVLPDRPADDTDGFHGNKSAALETIDEQSAKLFDLQQLLYADNSRKVLIVLQGMDTSGKDGTIKHVFKMVNPLGVKVANFKRPNDVELEHDYLWRVHHNTPGNGDITIFNRSHYEDVLVPTENGWITHEQTQQRYAQINQFERLLTETGTVVCKFLLHISKDEQRVRLQERLDDPNKHWKFAAGDLEVRKQWDAYQQAYADAIAATGTPWAPWTIVPANSKTHRNLMIAGVVTQVLKDLKLRYPPGSPELAAIRVE